MTDMLERGRAFLAAQPFGVLLGITLDIFEPGRAEMSLALKPEFLQQHGFAHGGVLSFMADNALTFAGGSVLGDVLTLEYKINYLRPAVGVRLVARARVTGSGKSQAVCHCDIVMVDAEGGERLCATSQGTIWKRG